MRISHKVDYALRATLELARRGAAQPLRSAEIADRAGVPEKYLEAILGELGRAGLVTSRRGPDGGHRLSRPAAEITVGDVYAAVSGPVSFAAARVTPREGGEGALDEAVAGVWTELEATVRGALAATTLEELRRRAEVRRTVLDFSI